MILASHRKAQQPPLVSRILASRPVKGSALLTYLGVCTAHALDRTDCLQLAMLIYKRSCPFRSTEHHIYPAGKYTSSEIDCNCFCRHAAIASIT